MISCFMNFECILGRTKLFTNVTSITIRLDMTALYVFPQSSSGLGLPATNCTSPVAKFQFVHVLPNLIIKMFWRREKYIFTLMITAACGIFDCV